MKLVAWNLGHQTIERPVKPGFAEAVQSLAPDLLTLNEYVHGESRQPLLEVLASVGLKHVVISERLGKNNQILIACRFPLLRGPLRGPVSESGASESNFLHASIPDADLEVVGVRAPAYEGAAFLSYWDALQGIMRTARDRRVVFIGDLNTDPDSPRRSTAGHFRTLRDEGWTTTTPSGAWSFVAGTRIDHAVASPLVQIRASQYVTELGAVTLASRDRTSRVSDHAALVVEIAARSGMA